MEEFILSLRLHFAQAGIVATSNSYGVTVNGCQFEILSYRRGFRIEGVRFRAVDSSKAAVHILEFLPKKLEEQKRRDRNYKLYREARDLAPILPDSLKVGWDEYHDNGKGAFQLTFTHSDKSTIMAALDYLQDGGFCEQRPLEHSVDWMLRIWETLPQEKKEEFLDRIEEDDEE